MPTIQYQNPAFTEADAVELARTLYGLDVVAEALPSERDRNFHIRGASGSEFVLKIANETEGRELLELQNQVMALLGERLPAAQIPQPHRTAGGALIGAARDSRGGHYFVRLLSYVPGKPLAHVRPHSPALLGQLGKLLGEVDAALADFDHPAAHRELKWDLQHTLWVRSYGQYLDTSDQRELVEHCLTLFRESAQRFRDLPRSVIYNDANDYNVIIQGAAPRERRVAGIIDFGDVVHTFTISELAVAAAYVMLGKPDPIEAASHLVAGYHATHPLSEAELEALFPLICARLSITVTNAAYQRSASPDNEYLAISEAPAWELMQRLASISPLFPLYSFREACQLQPVPGNGRVCSWLRGHSDQIGKVVSVPLTAEHALVFDLSIGSRELGNPADYRDVERFSQSLFGRMKAAGASVGVGRYNEARPVYTSGLFKSEGNDGPEWRTVHLGIDLFLEAGSPVYAPLDGRVHSLCNNAGLGDYGPTIILEHESEKGGLRFYTLYGHLSEDSLDGLRNGLPVSKGAQIAKVGNYPQNGDWPPHLHFQLILDLLGKHGEFPGVALPRQRDLWMSISPDPNLILRIPDELLGREDLSGRQILEARSGLIGRSLSISYKEPLHIVRGCGQYLYDADGRTYLDAVNNVCHVGHGHPKVVRAAAEQMAVLNTNTRYLHENLVRYAKRLCATLPEPLRVCFFVCSGSEANELAIRLARAHTGRRDLMVLDHAYHGNTTTLVEISPYKCEGPGGLGLASYAHKVSMPDIYRGPFKASDPLAGQRYAVEVNDCLGRLSETRQLPAAFLCESLPGCGGQIVLPPGYLDAAYRRVRAAGGLCIADEVQTGFGRAGSHFWAFELQGVVPDIVTMGKPIGNGHPMGAVVTTPEVANSFANGMEYFNTFGGNPVSCAVGLAVLDVIDEEQLQVHAFGVGGHLLERLERLKTRYPLIGDVRGAGLFLGVELVKDRETLEPAAGEAAYVVNRMKDRGILLSTDGPFHNVLKLKPPMVFSQADADHLAEGLGQVLEEF